MYIKAKLRGETKQVAAKFEAEAAGETKTIRKEKKRKKKRDRRGGPQQEALRFLRTDRWETGWSRDLRVHNALVRVYGRAGNRRR